MKLRSILMSAGVCAAAFASQAAMAMPRCPPDGQTTYVGDCGPRGGCEKHVVSLNYYKEPNNPSNWSYAIAVYRLNSSGWYFSEWRDFTWCRR